MIDLHILPKKEGKAAFTCMARNEAYWLAGFLKKQGITGWKMFSGYIFEPALCDRREDPTKPGSPKIPKEMLITVVSDFDPGPLRMAAWFIASGLDPETEAARREMEASPHPVPWMEKVFNGTIVFGHETKHAE